MSKNALAAYSVKRKEAQKKQENKEKKMAVASDEDESMNSDEYDARNRSCASLNSDELDGDLNLSDFEDGGAMKALNK